MIEWYCNTLRGMAMERRVDLGGVHYHAKRSVDTRFLGHVEGCPICE